MTNHSEQARQPLDVAMLADGDLYDATLRTIVSLNAIGELDQCDAAMARLAMELANRIDAEGLDCYVSLYARLFDALAALRHTGAMVSKQVASALAAEAASQAKASYNRLE